MLDTVNHSKTDLELVGLMGEVMDAGSDESDPLLQHMLRVARSHLEMKVAFISEFNGGDRIIRNIDGTMAPVKVGWRDPVDETYCKKVVDGDLPEIIHNAQTCVEAQSIAATSALGIGAHVSVPIHLKDGSVYGTFCVFDTYADYTVNERDRALVRVLADLAGAILQKEVDDHRRVLHQRQRIEFALGKDNMFAVWQPIVETGTRRIAGVEGLARFRGEHARSPAEWFAEAAITGLSARLESRAIDNALSLLDDLPRDLYISCNISANFFNGAALSETLGKAPLDRIVLELTEHDIVHDYATLARELAPLRQRGLRIAVDDAGAGYASFRHILRLRPEFIKMDLSLVRDIDKDIARRALAGSFKEFARNTDCVVVAEGVETQRELETLNELEIDKVQGYFLHRPQARDTIIETISASLH